MEIVEKLSVLSAPEVRFILLKIWENEGIENLTKTQRMTMEYLNQFSDISPEKARAAVKKLMDLGLKEEDAAMLVGLRIKKREEVRTALFVAYPLLTSKTYDEIIKILSEIRD